MNDMYAADAPVYNFYCSRQESAGKVRLLYCYESDAVLRTNYVLAGDGLGVEVCEEGCGPYAQLSVEQMKGLDGVRLIVPRDKNPRLYYLWQPYHKGGVDGEMVYFKWLRLMSRYEPLMSVLKVVGDPASLPKDLLKEAKEASKLVGDEREEARVPVWDALIDFIEAGVRPGVVPPKVLAAAESLMPLGTMGVPLRMGLYMSGGAPHPSEKETLVVWNKNLEANKGKMWLLRQTYALVLYLASEP